MAIYNQPSKTTKDPALVDRTELGITLCHVNEECEKRHGGDIRIQLRVRHQGTLPPSRGSRTPHIMQGINDLSASYR
jgi:hypothetical protein